MQNSIETILGIIATQLCFSRSEISETDDLINDLGADCLDMVEIVMALEEEFEIEIPEEELKEFKVVQDFAFYIDRNTIVLIKCFDCNGAGILNLAFHKGEIPCDRCEGTGKCDARMQAWRVYGKAIKEGRLTLGLTLKQGAGYVGMSVMEYSKVERGLVDNEGYFDDFIAGMKKSLAKF